MKKIVIELSFDDIVSDMFGDASHSEYEGCVPSSSFSGAVRDAVIQRAAIEIRKLVKDEALRAASQMVIEEGRNYVEGELREHLKAKLLAGEFSVNGHPQTLENIVESRLSTLDPSRVVIKHMETKAAAFCKELQARYDNLFAMKIVQSLNTQKLLSPEVSKMLLGDDDGTE